VVSSLIIWKIDTTKEKNANEIINQRFIGMNRGKIKFDMSIEMRSEMLFSLYDRSIERTLILCSLTEINDFCFVFESAT